LPSVPFRHTVPYEGLEEVNERTTTPEPDARTGNLAATRDELVGNSRAMQALQDRIARIARYRTNVLLLGESGTGKELVARALHSRGPRRERPFVPLNCAAMSREIIENELFGHERGAFTGANERKKGIFEVADGGTLFLDEIAEMEPSTQGKLLRVLERSEFRRLGGTGKVKVDVSVIAATNCALEDAVRDRRFREDLYYRLKVVTIVVPPLRNRKEDIPQLANAFLREFNERTGADLRGLGPRVLERLARHDWPGNVRELRNTIESGAVLTWGDTVSLDAVEDVMGSHRGSARRGAASAGDEGDVVIRSGTTLADAERELILAAVTRCRTKQAAARSLGIGVRTLFTKLRTYGAPGRASREERRARRS
jgi:DNA-binding NtrC family response regulator